jgi:hypothetical protein
MLQLVLHTENNLYARQIDPHVTRQVQNQTELGNILLGIEPRLASRTHGLHKASPLVETERLRVHVQHLGDVTNGKNGLIVFCHNVSTEPGPLSLLERYTGLG